MGQFRNALLSAAAFVMGRVDDGRRRTGIASSQKESELGSGAPTQLHAGSVEADPELLSDEDLEFIDDDPASGAATLPNLADAGLFDERVKAMLETTEEHLMNFSDDGANAAAGDDDDDDGAEPLRPTWDELGANMARDMLTNATGGSADDDVVDDPPDPLRARGPIRSGSLG
jgi:hypothetical protein